MITAILVLGFVCSAFLAFGGKGLSRITGVTVLSLVAAIALIAIVYVLNIYSTEQIVEGYVDKVVQIAGLSPYLTKAATFALLVPTLASIAWFFSVSPRRRAYGGYALAGLTSSYFFMIWIVTLDQKFSRDGVAIQCFVIREKQVVWRDSKYVGVDPESGRPCEIPTPQMLPVLAKLDKLLQSGRQLHPIDPQGRFFSPIGDPIIWYSEQANRGYLFFDSPGFDPESGRRLMAVTEEIIRKQADILKENEAASTEAQRKAKIETERTADQDKQKKEQEAKAATGLQEQNRVADLRSLVNTLPVTTASNWLALLMVPGREGDKLDFLAAQRLQSAIVRAAPNNVSVATTIFDKGFFDAGYFTQVMSGNNLILIETGVFEQVKYVAFGRVQTNCVHTDVLGALSKCTLLLNYKLIDKSGVAIMDDNLQEIGPGFSDESAVERAAELFVERNATDFFKPLGR